MPRRKNPQTLEEIRAEREHAEEKLRQYQNREKMLLNQFNAQVRKERTRRLCAEAGALEHFVPELADMDPKTANEFIETIATGQEADRFLRERGIRTFETVAEREEEFPCN